MVKARVRVSDAWIRLIMFTQRTVPHGDITVRIVNGEPTLLVAAKRRVRFDKPSDIDLEAGIEDETLELAE